jgi:hypothetical protein
MELSKQFIEETVIFMRSQKVASFEISPDGVMKVSFDPRFADDTSQLTAEMVKKTIQDLVVDGEKARAQEDEEFLFP